MVRRRGPHGLHDINKALSDGFVAKDVVLPVADQMNVQCLGKKFDNGDLGRGAMKIIAILLVALGATAVAFFTLSGRLKGFTETTLLVQRGQQLFEIKRGSSARTRERDYKEEIGSARSACACDDGGQISDHREEIN